MNPKNQKLKKKKKRIENNKNKKLWAQEKPWNGKKYIEE